MRKIKSFILSLLLIFAPLLSVKPVSANANDFYFKNFTADYYLTKQADGTSEMEVVEEMTAVFPSYNQNHGIERKIPFLNQNDTNLTMESTDNLAIEVTRNGVKEEAIVTANDTYFNVRIGDADTYLHGEQTYVLKYKFIHVITEFDISRYSEAAYQELYWDTNGTGWDQPFDEITINLHMDSGIYNNLKTVNTISKNATYTNKSLIHENNKTKDQLAAWCYVGRYGQSNQNRCKITDLEDGISFSASNLSEGENLTLVTNFNDNTFIVPENDFVKTLKIEDAKVDYYLSKDENGLSHVKVKETIAGKWPTLNEIKDFTRHISYVNRARNNFIADQKDLEVDVTIDGEKINPEIVNEEDSGRYAVTARGKSIYLHGEHTFTFEYELENVIEDASRAVEKDSKEILEYQDFTIESLPVLYEDVDSLTVDIHLAGDLKTQLQEVREGDKYEERLAAVCDDGSAKEVTKMACKVSETSDGYQFTTTKLSKSDTFTTILHFKADTFFIPGPNRNYLYYYIFIAVFAVLAAIIYVFYRKNVAPVKDRIAYLKNKPVAPQYTSLKDFTAAQLAKVYVKPTKNPKVATMLELIIKKKIELIKGEKKRFSSKYEWKVKILDLTDLSNEQMDLLKILNRGQEVTVGHEVELTSHSYSSALETAFNNYDTHVRRALINAGCFVEEEKKDKKTKERSILVMLGIILFFAVLPWIVLIAAGTIFGLVSMFLRMIQFTPFSIYEGKWLFVPMIVMVLIVFTALPILSGYLAKYKIHTDKGLDISNYMDGLKLYIKMAEADRLKFLQSVEGVDTSETGIVKLNEKLLPYAALFGLEKSWMNELSKYYELHEEVSPNWYASGFNYSIINSAMRSAVSRPIDTSSSGSSSGGSWSSSSSSSGGGGGGFSGGGGGGGGGGGW